MMYTLVLIFYLVSKFLLVGVFRSFYFCFSFPFPLLSCPPLGRFQIYTKIVFPSQELHYMRPFIFSGMWYMLEIPWYVLI